MSISQVGAPSNSKQGQMMFNFEFPSWLLSAFVIFYLFPVIGVGAAIHWRGRKTHLPWNCLRAVDMGEFGALRLARHIPVFNLWVLIVAIHQMRRQLSRGERDFVAQYEHFQKILSEDHRWMAHDRTVDTLTTRYKAAWDEHWRSKHFKRVDHLRRDLNLEPQYTNAKYRNGPVTTDHVYPGSFVPEDANIPTLTAVVSQESAGAPPRSARQDYCGNT
jgi:hypothetical protein